jgi:hypothetical protein
MTKEVNQRSLADYLTASEMTKQKKKSPLCSLAR